MGSQQFCLKWNNHQSNMLAVFEQLLSNEALVDVTLACEGLSLKAHKMVLSACSPFFQALFVENPCKHPIVILKDMRYMDLKAIVEFMYRGEVNVSQDHLTALLKTAETLKVKGLAEVTNENKNGGLVTSVDGAADAKPVGTPRAESPPLSKRKRGRPRRRSPSDSNKSDSEDAPPATRIKGPDSPEIIEDGSMSSDRVTNLPAASPSSRTSNVAASSTAVPSGARHGSSVQASISQHTQDSIGDDVGEGDDADFDVEPLNVMEQSMTTENVPVFPDVASSSQALGDESQQSHHTGSTSDNSALVPVHPSLPSDISITSQVDIKPSPSSLIPYDDQTIPPVVAASPAAALSGDGASTAMAVMDASGVPAIAGPSSYQQSTPSHGRVLCPCTFLYTLESTVTAPPTPECSVTTTDPPASECAVTAVSAPAASAPDSEEDRDHDFAAGDKIHLCAEEAGQYCIELYSSVEEGTDRRNDQPFEECSVTTTDPPASECAVTAVSAPAALAPDSEEGRDHDCAAGDKIHLCAEEAGQYCIEFYSSVEEGTDQRNDQPFEGAENACSEAVSLPPLDLTSRNLSVRKTKKIKRRNRPATGWDGVDALKRRKAAKGLQREFYCHYCPKVFTAASNLLRHERTHTGEKPYKCRYCPRRCADRGNLSRHEELHLSVKRRSLFLKRGRKQSAELQSTTEISERKKKQITKRRVRQTASSDGGDVQKRHNASTGSQRFMQCRYCSYKSCFPGNMKRHKRTHTGEKPYKCRYCPRRSADRGNLSRHEELHLSFKVRSLYIKRGRKQSTELQPTTEISERKKKQITKHRIQHAVSSGGGDVQKRRNASTGSQRYMQCSYCPYKSCFPGNMKRHERTHTGEKPYECMVCHKLFADPSGFNRHKALHE